MCHRASRSKSRHTKCSQRTLPAFLLRIGARKWRGPIGGYRAAGPRYHRRNAPPDSQDGFWDMLGSMTKRTSCSHMASNGRHSALGQLDQAGRLTTFRGPWACCCCTRGCGTAAAARWIAGRALPTADSCELLGRPRRLPGHPGHTASHWQGALVTQRCACVKG